MGGTVKKAAGLAVGSSVLKDRVARAEDEAVAVVEKKDNRILYLTAPVAAVTWALFNILGPGTNQLNVMSAKAAEREGTPVKTRSSPVKKRSPAKSAPKSAPKKS